MRLVWIKVGGLWPVDTGGRLRSFQILAELSRTEEVALVTTHRPGEEPDELRRALPKLVAFASVPHDVPKQGSWPFVRSLARSWASFDPVDIWRWRVPAVRDAVERLLEAETWDGVVADFLVAAANVPDSRGLPLVYFAHNVEYQIWKRLAAGTRVGLGRLALELEWRKMRSREDALVRRADLTIAVSEGDRDLLQARVPAAAIDVVPTGVDVSYFQPHLAPEVAGRLVFCGSMDWYPNEDGMLEFLNGVWPRLRASWPGISLTVVGRRPTQRFRAAAGAAGITVTGTVPDVREFVAQAQVFIVPLRVGGGTRLKILEALAMGKAVVSTSIGAEGLGLTDGHELLIADEPAEFAGAIGRLLGDSDLRARLGASGRGFVEDHSSWSVVADVFRRSLAQVPHVTVQPTSEAPVPL